MDVVTLDNFVSFTLGIVVYFLGVAVNKRVPFLRFYNIPDAVSGGLLAALAALLLYGFADIELNYQLDVRDTLLVYFFTAIGLNARLADLFSGGRPLLIMLLLTLGYMVVQNIVGMSAAWALELPPALGVLAGSASLIGGHGTAIAWSPEFSEVGVKGALEIGVASATIGLVIASLIGGPIAQFLISKHSLSGESDEKSGIGVAFENEAQTKIDHISLMSTMLVLHLVIIVGWFVSQVVLAFALKLPLFVCSLLVGIIMSNFVTRFFPKIEWPARSRALAVISDFSLSMFLVMSLMSMQLWAISGMASSLLLILLAQTVSAVLFIVFVLFNLMGRNYLAAVLSAGFGGFALGATPTAIANMTAVTKSHGPAPMAFIILPLISAFFVDISNSFLIRFAISL
ncbi:sodium/glutamate symporter [uncultured Pseudoteredinibacter sp.]|uniref:sodium/glutamate symporter n=1 Tax=uncultured Pseudoteredinibacter sp. TaxID=1641701 RepID=UPI00261312EC|nr:sodium/glutamate symporter [uncultured Pseudoteredinibacter sp.]